jgi:hypothetical protein
MAWLVVCTMYLNFKIKSDTTYNSGRRLQVPLLYYLELYSKKTTLRKSIYKGKLSQISVLVLWLVFISNLVVLELYLLHLYQHKKYYIIVWANIESSLIKMNGFAKSRRDIRRRVKLSHSNDQESLFTLNLMIIERLFICITHAIHQQSTATSLRLHLNMI